MLLRDSARSHSPSERVALGSGLAIGCGFALSTGFLDATIGMTRYPPADYSTIDFLILPLTATILLSGAVYLLGWPVLNRVPLRFVSNRRTACLIAAVLFLESLFTLGALAYLFPFAIIHENTSKGDYLLKWGLLFLVLGMVLFATIALAQRGTSRWGATRLPQTLLISLPCVLGETMLIVWCQKYRLEGLLTPTSLVFIFLFLLGVFATLFVFYLLGPGKWTQRAYFALFLAVVAGPVVFRTLPSPPIRDSATGPAVDHPIEHVILISIDTLRADFLSCYNEDALPTPNLDSLAADSLVFERAISAGPWTVPGVASMMTGVYPEAHHMTYFGARLPEQFRTLAEYFRDAGYDTAAIGENGNLTATQNFDQGFLEHNWFPKPEFRVISLGSLVLSYLLPYQFRENASTTHLMDLAVDWLETHRSRSFFLWLHIFDPHMPYEPPREFWPSENPPAGFGYTFSKSEVALAMVGKKARTADERAWLRTLYNGEVAYVDSQVGRILENLKRWGLYENSLIVLTSDHGEEFWEHGGFEHGQSLYWELLNVPFLVKAPGTSAKRRSDYPVSTASILPTLLDFCDIEFDAATVEAVSLKPVVSTAENSFQAAPVFSGGLMRGPQQVSVSESTYKYIRSLDGKTQELYDFLEDATELDNLVESLPDEAEARDELLRRYKQRAGVLRQSLGLTTQADVDLDESTLEMLRSMGYL